MSVSRQSAGTVSEPWNPRAKYLCERYFQQLQLFPTSIDEAEVSPLTQDEVANGVATFGDLLDDFTARYMSLPIAGMPRHFVADNGEFMLEAAAACAAEPRSLEGTPGRSFKRGAAR